jgi:hypothetical protein
MERVYTNKAFFTIYDIVMFIKAYENTLQEIKEKCIS